MAFPDFKTLDDVIHEFGLSLDSAANLFPNVLPAAPGPILSWYLERMAPQALDQRSEKARSEGIIFPFLAEAATRATQPAVIYSGVGLRATPRLSGFPDFMIGRGTDTKLVRTPLLAMVEAKDEKFSEGESACAAQMVGAREFNAAHGEPGPVFGCVTNAVEWFFYKLDGDRLAWQPRPVLFDPPDRLLGILIAIASGTAARVESVP